MQILEKRFGMVAVSMGFITLEQLKEGLISQAEENIANQSHRLIGAVLKDLGHLDSEQIAQILVNLNSD